MNYSEYAYLYPPRPEVKILRDQIGVYEAKGWHCQVKKNGTCTVIFARGDEVIFKTRHNDNHKMWKPKAEHFARFSGLSNKWNVFVAELLNDKTPHIKDHLYVHDQLVHDGVQLLDTTLAERHVHLHERFKPLEGIEKVDRWEIGADLSIAKNIDKDFLKLFDTLQPEDEGVVLKSNKQRLNFCFKEGSNTAGLVKSRIPHKNYSF